MSTACWISAIALAGWLVPSQAAALKNPAKSAKTSQPEPNNLKVTGQTTYISWPDPKRRGKFLAQLYARSFEGQSPQQTIYVTLAGVTGFLFENGVKSARFTAPRAQGDNVREEIVATGRVTFTSLTSQGIAITADKVVWSAKTNKGVATGNVVVHYGKTGMVVHTPVAYFDTKLRTVQSAAVSGTLP